MTDPEQTSLTRATVYLDDGGDLKAEKVILGSDWIKVEYFGAGGIKQTHHIPNERVDRVEEGVGNDDW